MVDPVRPPSEAGTMIETLREMIELREGNIADILDADPKPLLNWRETNRRELAALQYALDRLTWRPIEQAPMNIERGERYIGAHINHFGVNEVRLCGGDWSKTLTHFLPLPPLPDGPTA